MWGLRLSRPSTLTRNLTNLYVRSFVTSPQLLLKQIIQEKEGNNITISAQILPSERVPYLIQPENTSSCTLCSLGLDVKHTDVLILSQFVRSDGCMLPRRVTGLCKTQQKRMSALVTMAQKSGLMPNLNPAKSKKDPKMRYQWKAFNKYFDESTIKSKIK